MPEYWFVVKPEQRQLFDAIQQVLHGRPGFHAVIDRRKGARPCSGRDRRTAHVWEGGVLAIAERGRGPASHDS